MPCKTNVVNFCHVNFICHVNFCQKFTKFRHFSARLRLLMDASSVELAVQIAQRKKHHPVYSTAIVVGGILKENQILIVSTRGLEIFNKEKEKINWLKSMPWLSVRKVAFKNNKVYVTFDKEVLATKFISKHPHQLFGAICHALTQTQTIKELRTLGVSKYDFGIQQQTGIGIMSRLQQLLKIRRHKIPYINVQQFRQELIFNESVLDLREFPDPERILQYALDVLPLATNFNTVIFPNVEKFSDFQLYIDYIPHIKYVNHLEFNCKRADKFKRFLDEFQKKKRTPCGISINDPELPLSALKGLSEFIGAKQLTTFGLHTAFSAKTFELFYQSFFTQEVSASLVSLDLSNTQRISLPSLVPRLPKLLHLSLQNCGLQVDEVLSTLNSWPSMNGLRVLDLSGNACSTLFAKQLPSSLFTLILNNISWGSGCLATMVRILSTRNAYGIDVSLSSANADNNDWMLCFQEMENSNFSGVLKFVWDENPVDYRLFDFLLRSTELKWASFGGCFSQSDISEIDMFCEFISLCPNLNRLSLIGTDNRYIGESISSVIRAAAANKSIKILDISNNRIGKGAFSVLKTIFLTQSTLDIIDFDGAYPDNSNDLVDLLETAARSNKTTISFPVNDFNFLINAGKMTTDVCDKILPLFKKPPPKSDSQNSQFPFPSYSPFFDPFYVYRLERLPPFPSYITRSDAEKMKVHPPEPFVQKTPGLQRRLTKVASKPMMPFKPSPQKQQHLSISMLLESSEEDSDSFNTNDLQFKFSINDIMPNLKRPTEQNKKVPMFKAKNIIDSPNRNRPKPIVTETKTQEEVKENSESKPELPPLPKPPSPKSPKFVKSDETESQVPLSRKVKMASSIDVFNTNNLSQYASKVPIPASQYSSRIPLSASKRTSSTPIYKTQTVESSSEEEYDDYDDATKTRNTARIPFEGTYEYYSDDDFEEEEEDDDFFSTPPNSDNEETTNEVTKTQTTKESRFTDADISGDYSDYSDYGETNYSTYSTASGTISTTATGTTTNETNSPKFMDRKINLPPPPNPGSLNPITVARFDEPQIPQKTVPFSPQITISEEIGTSNMPRRVRPQRGQPTQTSSPPESKTYGSRLKTASQYGSRVRRQQPQPQPQNKEETSQYGSRVKRDQTSQYGSRVRRQVQEKEKEPATNVSTGYGSRVRGSRLQKPPPAPIVRSVRNEDAEYTYSSSGESNTPLQRPPPLPSPKSTTMNISASASPAPPVRMRNFK